MKKQILLFPAIMLTPFLSSCGQQPSSNAYVCCLVEESDYHPEIAESSIYKETKLIEFSQKEGKGHYYHGGEEVALTFDEECGCYTSDFYKISILCFYLNDKTSPFKVHVDEKKSKSEEWYVTCVFLGQASNKVAADKTCPQ